MRQLVSVLILFVIVTGCKKQDLVGKWKFSNLEESKIYEFRSDDMYYSEFETSTSKNNYNCKYESIEPGIISLDSDRAAYFYESISANTMSFLYGNVLKKISGYGLNGVYYDVIEEQYANTKSFYTFVKYNFKSDSLILSSVNTAQQSLPEDSLFAVDWRYTLNSNLKEYTLYNDYTGTISHYEYKIVGEDLYIGNKADKKIFTKVEE